MTASCRTHRSRTAIVCGLFTALTGSLFIYLSALGTDLHWLNTLAALLSLYLLLSSGTKVWFWSGFFFGLFWFWWIALSFIHYQMPWAIPFVVLLIAMIYGGIFWLIAKAAFSIPYLTLHNKSVAKQRIPSLITHHSSLITLTLKASGLLVLSYIHPFGFDWFKPELMFVESYLGVEKWQFTLILAAITLTIWKKQPVFLLLLLPALHFSSVTHHHNDDNISIVTTHTPVEEKWDKSMHDTQFQSLLQGIDQAIKANKHLVILPESVFPVFLNHTPTLFEQLQQRAKKINIVTGALYWDGKTPRNATYVFTTDGKVTVANKVVLVPFGEANPLPDFLSDWVNRIFYDGAVDYKASTHVADYAIDGKTYRNAICFEATSERLYEGIPKQMIVLSNNGWFVPSIEPTLQRLLLQYYSRKYGTTIYHAVNMSPSYRIIDAKVLSP
ncbi:MAG: apolipoprotein N-acyltransferase [Sulfurovum sp.]|nr:apolipoprotein N-acyltransferase [Sulfurovum sp.]